MKCQSCKYPKANLSKVNSKLLASIAIMICSDCKKRQFEPRHIIILAARSGVDVREYVVNRKYCGDELTAMEVTS
jgi:hypothetical protein